MRAPVSAVVDASVGIKTLLPEAGSAAAQGLFERFLKDPASVRLAAPDLFFVECANILWKQVHRGLMPAQTARDHVADLAALALPVTPTSALAVDAVKWAIRHDISAYDACYLALASQLGATLVTADERLAAKVASVPVPVVLLHDIDEFLPPAPSAGP